MRGRLCFYVKRRGLLACDGHTASSRLIQSPRGVSYQISPCHLASTRVSDSSLSLRFKRYLCLLVFREDIPFIQLAFVDARVKEDRPFLLTPALLHVLAEAKCCACVFVKGARGHISPVGSLSPYKNREHGSPPAQTHPELGQTSQMHVPATSSALGTKPRRGAHAGQHNALSPLHLIPAPRTPFVTPIPSAPQQILPCSSSSPKEDQARRVPACLVAVAGWPKPFLCQKRLF